MSHDRDPAVEEALEVLREQLPVILRHGTPVDREYVRSWNKGRQKVGLESLDDRLSTLGLAWASRGSGPLLTLAEFESLPSPEWLVDGWLAASGFGVLFGPSGVGKSFVALDMALSVAAGGSWLGATVQGGPVVYVLGEGAGRFKDRTVAWRARQGAGPGEVDLYLEPGPVNLIDVGQVEDFLTKIVMIEPRLVVFDTLARCTAGGDENSAKDMGVAIASLDRIRAVTGAAVLVVHHTGKKGAGERGSSALRGAADVMISLVVQRDELRLSADKLKDGAPPDALALCLVPVSGSLVVESDGARDFAEPGAARRSAQHARDLEVLAVLDEISDGKGASATNWQQVVEDILESSPNTFYRTLARLKERELVVNPQEGIRGTCYRLTPAGREAVDAATHITSNTPSDSDRSDLSLSSPPPPFRGGVGAKAGSKKKNQLGPAWDTDKGQEAG